MEKIMTYRYLLKKVDNPNQLEVLVVSTPEKEVEAMRSKIVNDSGILSCIREYVCSYEMDKLYVCECIKEEDKEEENKEEEEK